MENKEAEEEINELCRRIRSQIIKTNQNIQRTHPNRMDLNVFERKFNRIANRNRKK